MFNMNAARPTSSLDIFLGIARVRSTIDPEMLKKLNEKSLSCVGFYLFTLAWFHCDLFVQIVLSNT